MTPRHSTLAVFFVAMLGCQHEPPSISGEYVGTLESSQGLATIGMTLTDTGGALSGYAEGTGLAFQQQSYYVRGSHVDGSVDLTIGLGYETESSAVGVAGSCKYSLSGEAASGTLRGSYSTLGCEPGNAGIFDLRRQ
jgi:hypothetical protein